MFEFFVDCLPGFHGENCESECGHCKDGSPCYIYDGICPSGCDNGYTGQTCTQGKEKKNLVIIASRKSSVLVRSLRDGFSQNLNVSNPEEQVFKNIVGIGEIGGNAVNPVKDKFCHL